MAVPQRLMPYKHRSGTASPVWRGIRYCMSDVETYEELHEMLTGISNILDFSKVMGRLLPTLIKIVFIRTGHQLAAGMKDVSQ